MEFITLVLFFVFLQFVMSKIITHRRCHPRKLHNYILLIILAIFLSFMWIIQTAARISDFPIDIVFTWVNGSDENWIRRKSYWAEREHPSNYSGGSVRFRDNQELRYSLRAIFSYAPWIHQIFLVTNGQVPYWLNVSHPKITLVVHSQIMPEDALPTFNSQAIETCICNIHGLSEHFLYANDDYFIFQHTLPDFFFTPSGKAIMRIGAPRLLYQRAKREMFWNTTILASKLIAQRFGKLYTFEISHNIRAFLKSDYLKCKRTFPSYYLKTTYSKFRSFNCTQLSLVSYYMLAHNHAILENTIIKRSEDALFTVMTNPEQLDALLNRTKPIMFCINDAESVRDDTRSQLQSYLETIFPIAAPWEIR